ARWLAASQRAAALERVLRDLCLVLLGQHFRQRGERQPVAQRRIAFDEEDLVAAQRPGRREPMRGVRGLAARGRLERQDVPAGTAESRGDAIAEAAARGLRARVLG